MFKRNIFKLDYAKLVISNEYYFSSITNKKVWWITFCMYL